MKVLYLMWIDWRWIFQRPQILAVELGKKYELTVVFPRNLINRWKGQKNKYPVRHRIIPVIPFYQKISWLEKMMNLLIKYGLRNITKFDVIWVGYPLFAKYIPKSYTGKIIYDCMDNHYALATDKKEAEKIAELEKQLIKRADIIFATGNVLKKKIEEMPESKGKKIVLVRNGYDSNIRHKPEKAEKRKKYEIGYIGTIAEWMDYDVILRSLKDLSQINYHMIGLIAGNNKVEHPQIIYEGIVEHSELYNTVKDYSCLIMPFKVNDVVLSVDPVKLYEYISYGKCIVSVYYEEVERFRDYVYFYHSAEEYCSLMKDLAEKGFPPKYNETQQLEFLKENSWENRVMMIEKTIEEEI